MFGKAIRKAVLPIFLASLMVGTGCRIVYGKEMCIRDRTYRLLMKPEGQGLFPPLRIIPDLRLC